MRQDHQYARHSSPQPGPPPRQRGQACERCWKRKQKCDRSLPACAACVGVGVPCLPRKFTIEPPANNGRSLSHAAVPSYVDSLKRKRDDLESQLRRLRPQPPGGTPSERQQTRDVVSQSRQQVSGQEETLVEQDAVDTTVQTAMGEIGFLSRSAMAEPRDEISAASSQELGTDRMVRAALALAGSNPAHSSIECEQRIMAITDSSVTLKRHVAAPFTTLFLEKIGTQYPHINATELWEDFETFFDKPHGTTDPVKRFNVYMAVAIGMLLSPDSGSLHGFASNLHGAAVKEAATILNCGTRAQHLQCMLSLIIYSMHTQLGGSSWHLLGLAMKKAIAFRLHQDRGPRAQISSAASLALFQSLYIIDRTISTVLDRPFNIEDEDITIQFPDESNGCTTDTPHGPARKLIMHARLMSSIRDGASKGILYHYSNLFYWGELAVDRESTDPSAQLPAATVRRLTCHGVVEILKSTGSVNNIPQSSICSSEAIRCGFVESCIRYIEDEYQRSERGQFTGTFVDAYDIFAAGVSFLCLTKRSPQALRSQKVINEATSLLTLVGDRFSGLRIFRRVLWALFSIMQGQTAQDAIIQDLPPIIPGGIRALILEFLKHP